MLFLSVRPQVTFDWIYGLDLWLEVSRVAPGFRQAEILDLRVRMNKLNSSIYIIYIATDIE